MTRFPDLIMELRPPRETDPYPRWIALDWFAFYRLCLAAGLVAVYLSPFARDWKNMRFWPLTVSVSLVYLLSVLLWLLFTRLRLMPKVWLAQTGVAIDIFAFTLLMHANGGIESGFGLVLAITVAAGALLMEGKLSLLFAALASVGVLTEHAYMEFHVNQAASANFTRAGLLGATYFTMALLAHVLYRRIRETERLAASRQVDLADLSKLNEFIIQRMSIGVLVLDERRQIRLMNEAAGQLLGLAQGVPRPPLATLAPALHTWIEERVARGRKKASTNDGIPIQDREVEPSLLLLGHRPSSPVLLFLRDKRTSIQEAQQIKLASLGRLTASIAHNIRNPLSAINHAGQLLAESQALPDEDRQLIRIMLRNSRRIDEIIESVLQLSRRNRAEAQVLDPGIWIEDFASEFIESHTLPMGRLIVSVAAETPMVEVDPRHLRQILANLCDNALRHSGSAQSPACLELRAGPEAGGERAFIEVRDSGPAIDPETAAEMFTPFFTTSISGSGLGLYIALELSETNGIELRYQVLEDGGNCFRLSLAAC